MGIRLSLLCFPTTGLPAAPVISYFLCDSWYTTAKVMGRFIRKGLYTVGALKTNRIL